MDSSKEIGDFPEIYNFNWLFFKLTQFIVTSDCFFLVSVKY